MLAKKWLYYLIDRNGKSYSVNNNGIVQTSFQPTPLENSPAEWGDLSVGYDRDMKRLGVLRNFMLPQTLVKRTSQILRHIFFSTNFENQVYLLIQKLAITVDNAAGKYRMSYRYFYKGELDLSTYKYSDVKDTVLISEGGLDKLIKANEATTYEISIDDPEAITVKMDGIYLHKTFNWLIPELFIDDDDISHFHTVPIYGTAPDGEAFGAGYFDEQLQDVPSNSYYTDTPNYFLAVDSIHHEAIEFNIEGKFTIEISKNDISAVLRFWFVKNTGVRIQVPTTISTIGTHEVDISTTISLSPGEKLFMEAEVFQFVTGALGFDYKYLETTIRAKYKSKYKTTYIKALKPSTVFRKLIEKITGNENNCDTSYIEQYDNLLLTCGDALRGLEKSTIKTSLNNFSDFVRVQMAAGQSIEGGKFLYDGYSRFFQTSNPVNLGNVKDLQVSLATDLICNTVNVGYPAQEIENVNGKYSFNNTHLYTSPVSRVTRVLSLLCSYISDCYYTEITRINLEGKTTTDDKADNQTFILNANLPKVKTYIADLDNLFAGAIKLYGGAADVDNFLPGSIINISGLTTINAGQYTVLGTLVQGADILILTQENTNPETGQEITITPSSATLRREDYDSIAGVPDTELIFNIADLTPKRILLKHKQYLDSIFYGFAGQKLKFQSTEKNKDLVTILAGTEIKEKADYTITSDILFKPFYLQFETLVPVDLVEIMEEDPNRPFLFYWYGKPYKGHLVKAAIAANDHKPQVFKLLCSADTDLTNLK